MKDWTTPDTINTIIAGAALAFTAVEFVVSWRRAKQDRKDAETANTRTRAIAEMAQDTANRAAKALEEQAGYATAQAKREAARDMRQRFEAFIEDLKSRQQNATNLSQNLVMQMALQETFGHGSHDDGSAGMFQLLAERIDEIRRQAIAAATNFAVNRITVEDAEKELRRLDKLLDRIGEDEWPPKDADLPGATTPT